MSVPAGPRAVAVCAALALGCGAAQDEPTPPPRVPTVGDRMLERVPAGPDILVELDLDRLRSNAKVGPVVTRLADIGDRFGLGFELARDVDAIVMASYDVGTADARTVTLVRGDNLGALSAARSIDEHTAALGPDPVVARVEATAAGAEASVADDGELMTIRARAMPERAPGASLRITARLDFDARVSMASMLSLDAVPATVSVWGDVADDLAVVALLGGDDARDARRIAGEVERWRAVLARAGDVPAVARALAAAVEVVPRGSRARAVLVVGPDSLDRLVRRLDGTLVLEKGRAP